MQSGGILSHQDPSEWQSTDIMVPNKQTNKPQGGNENKYNTVNMSWYFIIDNKKKSQFGNII